MNVVPVLLEKVFGVFLVHCRCSTFKSISLNSPISQINVRGPVMTWAIWSPVDSSEFVCSHLTLQCLLSIWVTIMIGSHFPALYANKHKHKFCSPCLWPFSVAQDTFEFTLLKDCSHVRPRSHPNNELTDRTSNALSMGAFTCVLRAVCLWLDWVWDRCYIIPGRNGARGLYNLCGNNITLYTEALHSEGGQTLAA